MDSAQAQVLKGVDPTELGQRIAAARRAKGLTQGELAQSEVSVGYVSRIEAGQRRPTPAVLDSFAQRLSVSVDELLLGVSTSEYDELRLALDYAELALESGQAGEAATRSVEVVGRATAPALAQLRHRARYVHARALEARGELDDAIDELEPLLDELESSALGIATAVALSRCYRESGDLGRAVDVGERVLRSLADTPLEDADEAVQLAVTVAAAHFLHGDTHQAVRVCRKAVARAERLDSHQARAAAYWNASIMEAETGSVHNAVDLAERALALLREGDGERNLARLELELGILQLDLDPPEVDAARKSLERATSLFEWSSASVADRARSNVALSRADLLGGDPAAARALAEEVRLATTEQLPLIAAQASSIEGHAYAATGDTEAAVDSFQRAAALLTGVGADKRAAQLWYELADMLERLGDLSGAMNAYRSAAAASGLRVATVAPATSLARS